MARDKQKTGQPKSKNTGQPIYPLKSILNLSNDNNLTDKEALEEGSIKSIGKNIKTVTYLIDWKFENIERTEIVSPEFAHDELIRNFEIDDVIWKYYHYLNSCLISNAEFDKLADEQWISEERDVAFRPYPLKIFGPYYYRFDIYRKLGGFSKEMGYTVNEKLVKEFTDLIPYFEEYAAGFEDGFKNFEAKLINPFLTPMADQNEFADKVFKFITSRRENYSWLSIKPFKQNKKGEIVGAYKDGFRQGAFYRAWSIVFANGTLFNPLFRTRFKALATVTGNIQASNLEKSNSKIETPFDFVTIFNQKTNAFEVCKELFDYYELTINGHPNPHISKKRAGRLTGIISAIKDTVGMLVFDRPTDMQLLGYFNKYLNTTFSSFSKKGVDYDSTYEDAKDFINKRFRKNSNNT